MGSQFLQGETRSCKMQNCIPFMMVFYELKVCCQPYINFVCLQKFGSLLFSQIGFIELFKNEITSYVMLRIIFFKANGRKEANKKNETNGVSFIRLCSNGFNYHKFFIIHSQ